MKNKDRISVLEMWMRVLATIIAFWGVTFLFDLLYHYYLEYHFQSDIREKQAVTTQMDYP